MHLYQARHQPVVHVALVPRSNQCHTPYRVSHTAAGMVTSRDVVLWVQEGGGGRIIDVEVDNSSATDHGNADHEPSPATKPRRSWWACRRCSHVLGCAAPSTVETDRTAHRGQLPQALSQQPGSHSTWKDWWLSSAMARRRGSLGLSGNPTNQLWKSRCLVSRELS